MSPSEPFLSEKSSSNLNLSRNAPVYAALAGMVLLAFIAGNNTQPLLAHSSSSAVTRQATVPSSSSNFRQSFDDANARLIGPDPPAGKSDGDCPSTCGCLETPQDCPRWYEYDDILLSSDIADSHGSELSAAMTSRVEEKARLAKAGCSGGNILSTGGWCLEIDPRPERAEVRGTITHAGGSHPVPNFHTQPSDRIVEELKEMIQTEGIQSINDFGAGVGQYKAAILKEYPYLTYNAYDGAGNVVDWTSGFVQYFDLTIPLALPKSDWVISLEVGEHIPSRLEGMMIRNLHHHNCKGVILSWGVFGQGGHGHVNIHSNDYVIDVFNNLGYIYDVEQANKFRAVDKAHSWFEKSVMVFRRRNPVC